MSEQTQHDQDLTPPVERGKGWTCSEGHRHFVCYGCGNVFTASEEIDYGEHTAHREDGSINEEDNTSFCDDCYQGFRIMARAKGYDI